MAQRIAGLAMVLICCGCMPLTPTGTPSVERELPRAFTNQALTPSPRQEWWKTFANPELNQLVATALAENLTLREAWARLRQANALAIQAGAARRPDLSATAGATGRRQRTTNGRTATRGTERYSLGLLSNYELDLWGGIRSEEEAARLSEAATREDLNTLAMTVSAEVAERWVRIISQEEQRRLLLAQLATNETQLELMALRFQNALASSLDVFQQRQVVERTRSQIPLVEREEGLLRHELALLLGITPGGSGITGPTVPVKLPDEAPESGIPVQLLAERPDVRAAFLRLRASGKEIDIARANRLPQFRFTAEAAYEAGKLDLLFDNWLLNLAGNLTAPLVDGQKRRAEVARTRAVAAERLASYRRTILTAIKEVEDGLVTEDKLRRHINGLVAELAAAKSALTEAGIRYRNGLNDYLPVLTALVSTQNLERDLIRRKSDLLLARISLYRALGGTWTDNLVPPAME